MDKVVLKATRRSVSGKQVKALRREGLLPAVMYGHHTEPIAISLPAHESSLVLAGASSSTIVTIDLDGEQHSALVREKQRDYLKNRLLHVDFLVVSMNETLRASVSIILQGTSPAVEEQNAVLVSSLSQVEVEALPRDLPENLVVDISNLTEVGNSISVRDLDVPNGVTILTNPDETIVIATAGAREEEEEVEVEVADESAEPEVIERGKKDEDEEEE